MNRAYSGEFDPKWGRFVRTFDFRVKTLVSGLKEKDFFKKRNISRLKLIVEKRLQHSFDLRNILEKKKVASPPSRTEVLQTFRRNRGTQIFV